ncbi:MAG: hypothetical protein MUF61_00505 [archaeon]|jgi:hypothetical protein|nr:hypothetical protein [archaeon]
MTNDYLSMCIKYSMGSRKFKITGNVSREGRIRILEAFLREQMGAGVDNSEANRKGNYRILLKWYPENDDIACTYNTGNKGLRDGILKDVLSRLRK